MIAGSLSNLNGYNMSDAESMIYIANSSKLHVSDILYAGILISSLGAVMDVSVSIVAAITEIHEKAPDLKAKELVYVRYARRTRYDGNHVKYAHSCIHGFGNGNTSYDIFL